MTPPRAGSRVVVGRSTPGTLSDTPASREPRAHEWQYRAYRYGKDATEEYLQYILYFDVHTLVSLGGERGAFGRCSITNTTACTPEKLDNALWVGPVHFS